MLVMLDKEYSDITYVPAASLKSQIDDLCKRTHVKRDPKEALHLRPYYDHDERIKEFDESAMSHQSKIIENNPELQAQMKAKMEEKRQKELARQE